MNAAETRASSAIADCTPLAVVSRSVTTAEIDTFIKDVSTTSTNMAAANSSISRRLPDADSLLACGPVVMSASRRIMLSPTGNLPHPRWMSDS